MSKLHLDLEYIVSKDKEGNTFEVIYLGGNGWTIGCGSFLYAVDGAFAGSYFIGDVGGGVYRLGKPLPLDEVLIFLYDYERLKELGPLHVVSKSSSSQIRVIEGVSCYLVDYGGFGWGGAGTSLYFVTEGAHVGKYFTYSNLSGQWKFVGLLSFKESVLYLKQRSKLRTDFS